MIPTPRLITATALLAVLIAGLSALALPAVALLVAGRPTPTTLPISTAPTATALPALLTADSPALATNTSSLRALLVAGRPTPTTLPISTRPAAIPHGAA